jgi:hypothetical protein
MKKFLAIFLVLVMVFSLCACGSSSVEEGEEKVAIGYAIVEHWDGDEHIEFYQYLTNHGSITIWTLEEQKIVSTDITLIIY